MPELNLRQSVFTYRGFSLFTKKRRKNINIKKKQEIHDIFTRRS